MRVSVKWETDGRQVDLPDEVDVPDEIEDEDVAEYLSSEYPWLVEGWAKLGRRAATIQTVLCPNPDCESRNLQVVGWTSAWCRANITATADGIDIDWCDSGTEYGDDTEDTLIECRDCQTEIAVLRRDPFEKPDPETTRRQLRALATEIANAEPKAKRTDLEYETSAGMLPNIEALGSCEAYDAGTEAGMELGFKAALALLGVKA